MTDWWSAAPLASEAEAKPEGGNWWDAAPLADAPKQGATFDERFGTGPMARAPSAAADVAKTVPSALARGTAALVGIPGLLNQGTDWLFSKVDGISPEETGRRRAEIADNQRKTLGFAVPRAEEVLAPDTLTKGIESITGPLYQPQTTAGRYAGAVAEMAPGALIGGGSFWERALSTIGAGLGSEGLHDATAGTWFEPYAKMIGGIFGGVAGATVPSVASSAASTARSGARGATDPLTTAGRERLAARELDEAATDPQALRQALDQPTELVPGSRPTTFQQTGDMGIGALERKAATQAPDEFQALRGEQNAARVGALRDLQPEGSAVDVSNLLRAQVRELDDSTQAILDRYLAEAQKSADELGGAARPDEIGSALRASLESAKAEAKAQERRLWNAVDPDNTLTLDVSPLRVAARDIDQGIGQSAKPIAGEERAILDVVGGYQPVIPFGELTDLRSRVSTAMREERRASGETPVLARLTNLRGAIENTINTAVERRVAQEAEAVAAGAMRAEDTAVARVQGWIDDWRTSRIEATGTGDGRIDPAVAGSRASGLPRDGGAESTTSGRLGGPSGGPGVSRDAPILPNLDEAAAERLKAASAATRERAKTFNQGPVGESLRTQGMAGDYRSMDGSVPAKFFRPGPEGLERVEAYRGAVKNDAEAVANLANAAAASLRARAMGADGAIDPAKFAKWQADHAPALNAMPEVRDRFANASRAAEMVAEAAADRKQALASLQVGAAGKLIGLDNPDDVIRTVGSIFGQKDAVRQMRDLANQVRRNPEGMAGLRRAVADHIDRKFMSNTEAAASGKDLIRADQFQSFVRQNRGTLGQVFDQKEIQVLDAIAADLKRSNRSITAVKLPGQSNTAQDLVAQVGRSGGGGESWLSRLAGLTKVSGPAAGAAAGWFAGGFPGLVAGVGIGVTNSLRNAGMAKVQDLVKEALLDPELARALLSKTSIKPDRGSGLQLKRQLDRLSVFGAEGAADDERRPFKSGGRVEPSAAQKEAGNYRKDHLTFQGLPIAIETKKGQTRSGRSADGKEWSVRMPAAYGYIKRTEGADGDHVDAYIGPDRDAGMAWVVDQIDLKTRGFDEHKVLLGFRNRGHAEQAYRAGFSDGKGGKRIGAITAMSIPALKAWLAGAKSTQPVGMT